MKKALSYIPLRPIDSPAKNSLGETFYLAPNPPFGAVFTYYLKDALRTSAEARREEEKTRLKDGKPVTFPGWDALRKEEQEQKPEIVLTVTDETGQVVRRITGPTGKGLHRVAWDLRYPAVDPTQLDSAPRESWEYAPQGPLVVPGTFTRDAVEERRRRGDAPRPAADVRRRVAEPRHAAGNGQGGAAGLSEEGRRAAARHDGRGGRRRGGAQEPGVRAEGARRRAEG